MSRRALIDEHRAAINEIVRRHRGRRAYLFGAVAREEDGPDSDVDVLVEFDPDSSLFDLMHLQDDLEALLGCRVDAVSLGGLRGRDDHIRREAVPL